MSRRRTPRPPTPATDYPPGWFTEPCRAWKQLQYAGSLTMAPGPSGSDRFTDLAQRGRRKADADGSGWGKGTIVLPNTPKNVAPAWLARPRARG